MNRFEKALYETMTPTAELLERTSEPLHRAILLNFWRHVHLEGSGRFDEIVAPDMMVDHPVYRVTWGAHPAVIEGKDVLVSSPQVKRPVAVRYGWADNPEVNLYNGAGLPASPFRTDDFPSGGPARGAQTAPAAPAKATGIVLHPPPAAYARALTSPPRAAPRRSVGGRRRRACALRGRR